MPEIAESFDSNDLANDYKTIDDENVVYQITTYGADFTVDGLVKRFERDDIFVPDFQRSYVWTLRQASKFIRIDFTGASDSERVPLPRGRNSKAIDH
ncbi:MAG: hypothetical protein OXD44_03120 [Gammaproteobacteria bacterium]|nr:hypothetical protein [Gammaproteobacteria bacterium]MCY4226268.1 hypothetical protein [Gammaproteobacteria bacterium]MCY4312683.1 hypothetical protein [Gammaproteobacteria bacterium]